MSTNDPTTVPVDETEFLELLFDVSHSVVRMAAMTVADGSATLDEVPARFPALSADEVARVPSLVDVARRRQ